MTRPVGTPPGRAGRIWLVRRLRTAERGAELLDRKLKILRGEQRRYRLLCEQTRTAWEERCAEAQTWLTRAAMLGGQRAVRHASVGMYADVHIDWVLAMGVRYPAEGSYVCSEPEVNCAPPSTLALLETRTAFKAALDAAVRNAVAQAALRAVEAEVAATSRRRRAIEQRWVPALAGAIRDTDIALDELEHADAIRLRWVARRHLTTKEDGR